MSKPDADEAAVIQDLIKTLQTHLADGFDGRKMPLTEGRRTAMNQLALELGERLTLAEAVETHQQAVDRFNDSADSAPRFNDRARQF